MLYYITAAIFTWIVYSIWGWDGIYMSSLIGALLGTFMCIISIRPKAETITTALSRDLLTILLFTFNWVIMTIATIWVSWVVARYLKILKEIEDAKNNKKNP